MKRLRFWFALLIAWLLVLWSVERFGYTVRLDSVAHPLAAAAMLTILLWQRASRWRTVWIALVPVPFYLGAKLALEQPLLGAELPSTVATCALLSVGVGLAHRVSLPLAEFSDAVSSSLVRHLLGSSAPFEAGQSEIYREIHRARRHGRQLALLSIAPAPGQLQAPEPLIEQVQRETMQRYVTARIADLLAEEFDDYDVVTYRDDHFVTLLPETSREEAVLLAKRLASATAERLGLVLRVGVSTFPDEEVTFDKLLETAEADMRRAAPAAVSINGSGGRDVRTPAGNGAFSAR